MMRVPSSVSFMNPLIFNKWNHICSSHYRLLCFAKYRISICVEDTKEYT